MSNLDADVMVEQAKHLVCDLCRNFYTQGWVSGTGGGISIKVGDQIVVAPSGVQKERMEPDDMFVLNTKGDIVYTPAGRPPPYKPPKLSECTPLFMAAYDLRDAGAVMHSHSMNAVLATLLDENATEFRVTHLEMIKGIAGHGFFGNCIVPIIENTARECELTDRLRRAIEEYPESNAVLVRRHGVYVWGKTWIEAKTQSECYDYLFEAAVKMRTLGIDATRPPAPLTLANGHDSAAENGVNGVVHKKRRVHRDLPAAIVLDIEGTVASLSFVHEVLFPYAQQHLEQHLEDTFATPQTQHDIQLLRQLGVSDAAGGRGDAVLVPPEGSDSSAIIAACLKSVTTQMSQDRKTTALKSLQGHIWHSGFAKGKLKCELFRDVPDNIKAWRDLGIKTYIYSSGSRQAQADLFGHTTAGDLRPYLYGFFDTTSGSKVEAASYENIALSLGVDAPSQILFATDNILEAEAAQAAGWKVALTVRPGNKALPSDCKFRIVDTLQDLIE